MIVATHVIGDRAEVEADLGLRVLELLLVLLERLRMTIRAGNAFVMVLILLIRVEIV